jgi:hypothetical protein
MSQKKSALEFESIPDDLPELPEAKPVSAKKSALEVARFCPTCKQEARIVSNYAGVRAFCGPCKTDWPVSGPVAASFPINAPRGFSKRTLMEPDTSLAFEDMDDDEYKPRKE